MADFTFVQDDRFRASLESDYAELLSAAASGAWKAVHVMAGSIIEAVLIDFLLDTKQPGRSAKDPLKLDLGEAIDICHKEKVLSDKAAALCHVVRGYRNLIHPGRVIRLSESVDENGGKVAIALTEMITSEVGKVRTIKVGYTAEQLATKLLGDPSASNLLKHLIPRLSKSELDKLLMKVIPERYQFAMETESPDDPYPRALKLAYAAAFASADEPLRRRFAAWYAAVVRDAPQGTVHDVQEAFLRAPLLSSFETDDKSLVLDHLLGRMKRERSEALFQAAAGIGPHISRAQAGTAVDVVVHEVVHGKSSTLDATARSWLLEVFDAVDNNARHAMEARLDAWISTYTDNGETGNANAISSLLTNVTDLDDLPF